MPIYPISFSIPGNKIVNAVPNKTRLLAHIVPGCKETYIYTTEEDYYRGYRESWFALTCKKGGWDCMRHYEIIANGCIPLFLDLDECPDNTMTTFPKDIVRESNALYFDILSNGFLPNYETKCREIIELLLEHAKKNMTCIMAAKYIIKYDVKTVLFLSEDTSPDYLRCLTLTGFKELLGANCHDYPRIPHIYNDYITNEHMWGRGITYSNNISVCMRNNDRDNTVEQDIINNYYDIIVYGSGHRGMPLIDLVNAHYKPENIHILCGEDFDLDKNRHDCCLKKLNHNVYVREL